MEIRQKRGAHSTQYVFHDDRVDYAWKDGTGSRSFSVPYTDISKDRQTLSERQTWFRNAGLLWMLFGAVFMVASWSTGIERGGFWFLIGAICYAVYHFNVTRYVILPSDKGNLLVLDNDDGKRIVGEIERRRAAMFRAEYDFFPEGDSPERLRSRFDWLRREGALSDEEHEQRLATVERMEQSVLPEAVAETGRLLH